MGDTERGRLAYTDDEPYIVAPGESSGPTTFSGSAIANSAMEREIGDRPTSLPPRVAFVLRLHPIDRRPLFQHRRHGQRTEADDRDLPSVVPGEPEGHAADQNENGDDVE
jgi:hypothetical protein